MITSVPVMTLLVVVFFTASVLIAFVKKINIGILGLNFAILLAALTGLQWKQILSVFPTMVIMTVFSVTMFFGYFAENGTIRYLADRMMHAFCRSPKVIPYAIFFMAMILSAIGGSDMVVFSAAVAFPICKTAGMKAHHTASTLVLGSMVGSCFPWSLHGSTAKAIIDTMNDGIWAEQSTAIAWGTWATALVVDLIVATILYFAFRSHRLTQVEPKPLVPATPVQKKSLVVLAVAFCFIVLGPVVCKAVGGPVFTTIGKFCAVAPVCIVGSLVNTLLGLADQRAVIRNRVPWTMMTMLFGMSMLFGLGTLLGVNDYLGQLASALPGWSLVPFFVLLTGVLSLVASSLSVIYPLLLPVAGTLAAAGAVDAVAVMSGIILTSAVSSMSPFAAAGSLVMSGCPDDIESTDKLFNGIFVMALVCTALLVLASCIGMFGLWGLFSV